jgi:hypothetical protein
VCSVGPMLEPHTVPLIASQVRQFGTQYASVFWTTGGIGGGSGGLVWKVKGHEMKGEGGSGVKEE